MQKYACQGDFCRLINLLETPTGFVRVLFYNAVVSRRTNNFETQKNYIFYDSQQKYNIKQSEPISYNGIDFDSDTAIGDDYGQW